MNCPSALYERWVLPAALVASCAAPLGLAIWPYSVRRPILLVFAVMGFAVRGWLFLVGMLSRDGSIAFHAYGLECSSAGALILWAGGPTTIARLLLVAGSVVLLLYWWKRSSLFRARDDRVRDAVKTHD